MESPSTKDQINYSRFTKAFENHLGLSCSASELLLKEIQIVPDNTRNSLDHVELLLAVGINAKLSMKHKKHEFTVLVDLLINKNEKAIKFAQAWFDKKMTLDQLFNSVNNLTSN